MNKHVKTFSMRSRSTAIGLASSVVSPLSCVCAALMMKFCFRIKVIEIRKQQSRNRVTSTHSEN